MLPTSNSIFTSKHTYAISHAKFCSLHFCRSDPVELVCLNADETDKLVKTVPDWTLVKNSVTGDALKRSFVFADFQEAFLFMAGTAQLAEKNQHHPDWHNLWNTVDVTLTTDDKACLSTFDIELAQGMDLLLQTKFKKTA